jgi:hypothetical protein
MKNFLLRGLGVAAIAALAVTTATTSAQAAVSWKNCTAVNKTYPHGVGRTDARDRTSGRRVTNFKKSNTLYAAAMRANKGLDRDKDRIACEKR